MLQGMYATAFSRDGCLAGPSALLRLAQFTLRAQHLRGGFANGNTAESVRPVQALAGMTGKGAARSMCNWDVPT
jgi:hypothetical protein